MSHEIKKGDSKDLKKTDLFSELRKATKARIGLSSAGTSLSTRHQLEMMTAHARAKDAITYPVNFTKLAQELQNAFPELTTFTLKSQVQSRQEYLRRPDLGRLLSADSKALLESKAFQQNKINFIIVDGLSGFGVDSYATKLVLETAKHLDKNQIGDLCLVAEGRVAIGDDIGEILQSQLTVVIIGERPGLTSYDSVGAYLTFQPRKKKTDADRNCISNICDTGLQIDLAAFKLAAMIKASLHLKISGTELKEDQALLTTKS